MKLFFKVFCFIVALAFMPLWIGVNLLFPLVALSYKIGWPSKRLHFSWHNSWTHVTLIYNVKELLGVK